MKYSNVAIARFVRFLDMFEAESLPLQGTEPEYPIIHTYSRAQAIEDGTLIDVSRQARELDFLHPVAVTAGVWGEVVSAPVDDEWREEINEDSRILTLIDWALAAIDVLPTADTSFKYKLRKCPTDAEPREIDVRAVMGPGDEDERVLTIMLVSED